MKKTTIIIILIIIITIIISIIYNNTQRLELNGKQNVTLSYREEYMEPGVIIKNANNNNLSKIKIENNINTKKTGNYYVEYTLKLGIRTLKKRRNIKIIDNVQPVIKLEGEQIIRQSINQQYKEPGYTAYDEYDGNITEKVETTTNLDITQYGEYIITYSVQDYSGNITKTNRIIKIIDEIKPKIECKGTTTKIKQGTEKIIDCIAKDNLDGDITKNIEIIGIDDYNKPGIYDVLLKVKDNENNEATLEHEIIIY